MTIPEFVVPMWIGSVVVLVVCAALLVRGSRGGEVSAIETLLTPFAMPLGVSALLALVISGIGSLLLAAAAGGKMLPVFVATGLTIGIMIVAGVVAGGGQSSANNSH